jgi:hypothetical protein
MIRDLISLPTYTTAITVLLMPATCLPASVYLSTVVDDDALLLSVQRRLLGSVIVELH